jgi:hypothetical protein
MNKQLTAQHPEIGKPVTVFLVQVLIDVRNKMHDHDCPSRP